MPETIAETPRLALSDEFFDVLAEILVTGAEAVVLDSVAEPETDQPLE